MRQLKFQAWIKQDTLLWMGHESVEVIGNIHENPELLGGDCGGDT